MSSCHMLYQMSPELASGDHGMLHTEAVRQQCDYDARTMKVPTSHSGFLASSISLDGHTF